jgi:hypothetical protein
MQKKNAEKKCKSFLGSKAISITVFLLLLLVPAAGAADIELGLHYGFRQMKDANLKNIYGSGTVFRPQVRYVINRIFALEAAYEGGYKKDGLVGIYNENSTLTMNAVEAAAVLRMEMRGFIPFIKGGIGYYGYKQDIDSPFIRQQVNHHTTAPFVGAGLDIALLSGLYLSGAVHYVPLKVKPFDIEVDLSGLRILVGLRYRLAL